MPRARDNEAAGKFIALQSSAWDLFLVTYKKIIPGTWVLEYGICLDLHYLPL